jgi:hypothetical protein
LRSRDPTENYQNFNNTESMNSNHMELNQRSIEEIEKARQEREELRRIVDKVFNTDLMNKRRYQSIVEARMVFSKILSDRGHSITTIGKYLNKNHSTIIHYNRNVSDWLEQSVPLFNKYMECKDAFVRGREPIVPMTKQSQMVKRVENLTVMVDNLVSEKEYLRMSLKKYKRFERILDLLSERVRVGDEEEMYRRVNAILNK